MQIDENSEETTGTNILPYRGNIVHDRNEIEKLSILGGAIVTNVANKRRLGGIELETHP